MGIDSGFAFDGFLDDREEKEMWGNVETSAALRQAARCVAQGGKLEIVDFGQQERLPRFWKRALFGWLGAFHVSPRAGLHAAIEQLAQDVGGVAQSRPLYRGYAVRGGLSRV